MNTLEKIKNLKRIKNKLIFLIDDEDNFILFF